MPWTSLKEKMFLLHMQDSHDDYDIPEEAALNTLTPQAGQTTYTNYTCGPAYMKWHSLVFGMETNHGAITDAGDVAESGMVPCAALLKMGSGDFPGKRTRGILSISCTVISGFPSDPWETTLPNAGPPASGFGEKELTSIIRSVRWWTWIQP